MSVFHIRSMRLLLAGVLVLGLIGAAKRREIYEALRFRMLSQQCREYVAELRRSRPVDVSPERWDEENFGVEVAVANVCFSTHHVPLPEMERFTADFAQRMNEPIDLTTIDWLWERLAATGDHGARYVTKWRPVRQDRATARRTP